MTNQKSFPDLIQGKTVALVGPADSVGDQGPQVEACDTVIRINYRWRGNLTEGYGDRVDVGVLNVMATKEIKNRPEVLEGLKWVLVKEGAANVPHPNVRWLKNPFALANQIPILLHEIEQHNPAGVWVFGADFYTGGPRTFQQPGYRPLITMEDSWKGIQTHNQRLQHEWMRAFQDRTGLIKGDSRLVELLKVSTDELMNRLLDAWRTVSG
jgi:hypothetical protein